MASARVRAIGREGLKTHSAHKAQVVKVMADYASLGSNLCIAALAGAQQFRVWRHYPSNDATDVDHQTEFYYHAHAPDDRAFDEHGHFHVFSRSRGGQKFHHIVGISLDNFGMPGRLFLTNQWVTGEDWISAKAIGPMVRRFECGVPGRLAPVSRWITAMVHLFADDILQLHFKRECWWSGRCARGQDPRSILESRRFQVVAQARINLVKRLVSMN